MQSECNPIVSVKLASKIYKSHQISSPKISTISKKKGMRKKTRIFYGQADRKVSTLSKFPAKVGEIFLTKQEV